MHHAPHVLGDGKPNSWDGISRGHDHMLPSAIAADAEPAADDQPTPSSVNHKQCCNSLFQSRAKTLNSTAFFIS